jgi:hypothetical protein
MTNEEPPSNTDTTDHDSPATITTEEEFHEALRRLVLEADANDVDVRGGWPIVDGDRGWDLEIVETAGRST